jgi:uncharacterized protein
MKIKIKNQDNENLIGFFHKANNKKKVVVICHGFPGNKEEKSIRELCEKFEEAGINCFRFDFSGFGESEGKIISTTKRLRDLGEVVNYFKEKNFEIGLIGHSWGGMNAVLFASEDETIKFVISIAGTSDTKNFLKKIFPEQKEKILKGEMFYYGDKYLVTPETIRDLESYEPLKAVKKIKRPVLFIHGKKDTSVDIKDSEEIYQHANKPKEIKFYENADHNFSNVEDLEELINYCIKWVHNLR